MKNQTKVILTPKLTNLGDVEVAHCQRIVNLFKQKGFDSNLEQAALIWRWMSHEVYAGWLFLPDSDDKLWDMLLNRRGDLWN